MLNHLSFDWPVTSPSVRDSILRAINSGEWGKYHGQFTADLVARLCDWLSVDHTMLCCSGTIAVELALRGVGIQPGDEVILAGYDFPGNFRSIEAIGAMPVLVDVVPNGWVIDPDQVANAVGESTRAVIVSHLHGQNADVQSIRSTLDAVADSDRPIAIVEDVCQAPGGRVDELLLGRNGDVAVFSFGGSKLLSAGRGGAVTTNDPEIAQRIKVHSERGNDSFPLSQLQAAALLPQLEELDRLNQQRLAAAIHLCEQINQIQGLRTLDSNSLGINQLNAIYKIPICIDDDRLDRATLLGKLCAHGLPIGSGFRGFYRRSKRRCRKPSELENSIRAAESTMLLHHPVLLHDRTTLDLIVECLKGALDSRSNV